MRVACLFAVRGDVHVIVVVFCLFVCMLLCCC